MNENTDDAITAANIMRNIIRENCEISESDEFRNEMCSLTNQHKNNAFVIN